MALRARQMCCTLAMGTELAAGTEGDLELGVERQQSISSMGHKNEASLRLFVSPARVQYTSTSVIFNLKAGLALKICIQRVSLEFENRKRAK